MAQSTVKLIVDAQNAITPLKRVNEQTKALSSSTDKLKGRLDRSNRSLRNTGRAAKTASAGVSTLTKAFAPLLAAVSVLGAARFVFVKTAELETQRKSLEVLTGSVEKTNEIIQELQDFGAVTPFTSSELIEVSKRMKAFGFETERVVDITKRIADIAGTAGADINNVALAIGKVQAKNKFMQEENVMLLEKGINVTKELEKITGKNAEGVAEAMRKGEISADLFAQAIVNLTSKGGEFFEGASAQSDTLNGKLSTLQDTIDTLARTIGTELEDEIKDVLDLAITSVKTINELFKNIGLLKKIIDITNPFQQLKIFKKQLETQKDINKTAEDTKDTSKKTKQETQETTLAFEKMITPTDLLNENLGQTNFFVGSIDSKTLKLSESFVNITSEADQLKQKFMEIGQAVEQGIVSNLTDAVMGTQTLAQAAINVLNQLKRKLVEVAIQRAVSGIGNFIGGALGGIFGGGGGTSLTGNKASNFLEGVANPFARANGGPVSAGGAFVVGEKGPELLQMGSRGGNIIPNNQLGGSTTNIINVSVNASGSSVEGDSDGQQFGEALATAIQLEIVKQKRSGGLLA